MKVAISLIVFHLVVFVSNLCVSGDRNYPSTREFEKVISTQSPSASPSPSLSPDILEKIRRVENGLLFPVIVKGQQIEALKLSDRMAATSTPAVSVAVINNGRVEWAKGYGLLDAASTRAVTAETLFQAGSISKAVTAVAVMRLVERRKLDLDEDVNKKLVSWKVPDNDFTRGKKVTLRGLLSHNAGVNVPSFIGYLSGEPVPTLVQVLDGTKPANTPPIRVDSVPGSGFRYSGGGLTIVQQLLIDTEKKPFPDLMRKLVFEPLGMNHTTFEQTLPTDLASLAAAGHDARGEKPAGRWRIFPEMAAAGMWSTPSDLARLAIELQRTQTGQSKRFLSSTTVDKMFSRQAGNWGLGFAVEGEGRTRRFEHGGSTREFNSFLVAYNTFGKGAVIMVNSLRGERVINELLRSIAREYGWNDFQPKEKTLATIDPRVYADYVGQYQFEFSSDYVLTIGTDAGNLTTELRQPTSVSKTTVYPESETNFFRKDVDVEVTFVRDETGRVTHLIFRQEGQDFRVKRVK